MDGYRLQMASDVFTRDGISLELYDPKGHLLAEIFRDDTTGDRMFNSMGRFQIQPGVLGWFLDEAARRL